MPNKNNAKPPKIYSKPSIFPPSQVDYTQYFLAVFFLYSYRSPGENSPYETETQSQHALPLLADGDEMDLTMKEGTLNYF